MHPMGFGTHDLNWLAKTKAITLQMKNIEHLQIYH